MSERKEQFTPGPWRVHLDKRNGTVCAIIEDKSGDCVSRTFPRYPRGERNANGYLIAVAPEMYDFVHFFETVAGQMILLAAQKSGMKKEAHEIYEEAVRLCKKARGEE